MTTQELLSDFARYCAGHPEERFWQALRNWSGFGFVLVTNDPEAKRYAEDTFYWRGKHASR